MNSHVIETPTTTNDSGPSTPSMPAYKALETSRLAGITFENSHGRFVCLFWQASTLSESRGGDIIESTFKHCGSSWKFEDSTVVCRSAKKDTPLAAICWANGQQRAVYYLSNEWNLIEERVHDAGNWRNGWEDGNLNLLKVAPRTNSSLAASLLAEVFNNMTVNLYYQDWENRICGLQKTFSKDAWGPWECANLKPFGALSGTSIACAAREGDKWVYTVQENRHILEHLYKITNPQVSFTHGGDKFMLRTFDRDDTISVLRTSKIKLYINDGQNISSKIWDGEWNFRTNLPDTGTVLSKRAFIALSWAGDMDNPLLHQTHLFAMKSDGTVVYNLVEAPGLVREFSIIGCDED